MSSTIKSSYGTSNQAFSITLTSLANAAARGAAAIDNTTNLFLDALVFVKIKSGASSVAANGIAVVYAYATADGGTTYSDGVSGTNAGQTLTVPPNLKQIGTVNMVANATTYDGGPFSVAQAFGGILPDHWGIVVVNGSGDSFDASIASAWYQGIYNQIV